MALDPRDKMSIKFKDLTFNFEVEARWAAFFDSIGVEWHYNYVMEFDPKDLYPYRPTFYLPHVYLRSEKQEGVLMEVANYSMGHIYEHQMLESLAAKHNLAGIIANQFSWDPRSQEMTGLYQVVPWEDDNMMIYRCSCGCVKFEFADSSYMNCHNEQCKRPQEDLALHYNYAAKYSFVKSNIMKNGILNT